MKIYFIKANFSQNQKKIKMKCFKVELYEILFYHIKLFQVF